jgi:1-acyl-sn-glycerol-3-phosphate acyltransferase
VVVNAMHPGWADTPAVRASLPRFHCVMQALLRTPAEGADTVVWLAACPHAREWSGRRSGRPSSARGEDRARYADAAEPHLMASRDASAGLAGGAGAERRSTVARRLLTIPGFALAALAALASAPLWLPVAGLVDLARRRGAITLRSACFLAFYLVCELVGLLISAGLWLARPFARWDAERWSALHFRLQDGWGTALLRAATRCFDLRFEIEEQDEGGAAVGHPPDAPDAARLGQGPYLLMLRHASTGDTLLASALVGWPHGMRLRYVLKRELLWDPCLDVVGNRLPHVFVDRASDDSQREIARVQALARDLSARDGVLIYPEGTRFSHAKRARVLERLAREGDAKQLEYARSLHGVLPPRTGGALGLLEAAPQADVVVCAHTGFERAASLARIWSGELLHATIRVRFQRIPRARIPHTRAAQAEWLRERWQEIDAWVASQRAR